MNVGVKILKWNNFHVILFTFLFILYSVLLTRIPLLIAGVFSFLVYWFIHFDALKVFKPFAGYANYITLIRLILVLISGILYKNFPEYILFITGISIFFLDGLDGFIARKLKQTSDFGAYFDMETDAFYVCVFTIILFEKGLAGFWIIIPGFMRYIYGVIVLLFGKKSKEEIRSKYGPFIAGTFFVSILSPFILSTQFYFPILIISSALLMLSFLYSFIQIFKIRPE